MKDEEAGVCEWERSKVHGKGRGRNGTVPLKVGKKGRFNSLLC